MYVLYKGGNVNWAFRGEMTPAEMMADDKLKHLFDETSVLIATAEEKPRALDFRFLSALVGMYANYDEDGNCDIDTSDPQAALEEVISRMNVPPVTLSDVTDAVLENTVTLSDHEDRVALVEEAILELSTEGE